MDGWTDAKFPSQIKHLQRPPRVDVGWTGWTAAATGPAERTSKRPHGRGVTSQQGVQAPPQALIAGESGLQRQDIILARWRPIVGHR
mgnify:CR=1 FL=1